MKNELAEIKQQSIANKVAIIRPQSLEYILKIIKDNDYKTILEIGTGCGYSAYHFAMAKCAVTSIEKDVKRYEIAKHLLQKLPCTLINDDATTYMANQQFDIVFLDGPKAHQEQLLYHYLPMVKTNGLMIIDNIFLLDIKQQIATSKRCADLYKKVEKFQKFLRKKNKLFEAKIMKIEDGLALIKPLN